jgi:mono/diheme cytochrome c family protein
MAAEEQTMSRTLGILILFLVMSPQNVHAQEAGNPRAGLMIARQACASCHGIMASQAASPRPQAPSFQRIASVPGMTPTALTVAMRTSHRTMPNIMLEPKELRDVIAYIISLQARP